MATTKSGKQAKKRGAKTPMTAAHKAALAVGRAEGRAVRRYLEALEETRPRRGRKRTPQSIEKRLAAIDASIAEVDPLSRLQLTQEQMDLEAELANSVEPFDIAALEKEFVKVARDYGSRKGISYAAWRSVGVSASVLQEARITRSSR